jgi:hypothetical protein
MIFLKFYYTFWFETRRDQINYQNKTSRSSRFLFNYFAGQDKLNFRHAVYKTLNYRSIVTFKAMKFVAYEKAPKSGFIVCCLILF